MATSKAVLSALKLLSRAFAGVVDAERVELYRVALADMTDEEIERATVLVIRNHTGEFIPPPAVLRKAVAPAPVAVDAPGIIRRIEKLATYNPNCGMLYPAVDTVREQLGEAASYAYAAAGGPRLFAEDDTTRSIATREFQRAMVEAASRPTAQLPVITAQSLVASSSRSVQALIASTAQSLGSLESRHIPPAQVATSDEPVGSST
jgi:hypothetical protein